MIQRIQSIYLIVVAAVAVAMLFLTLLTTEDNAVVLTGSSLVGEIEGKNIEISGLAGLTMYLLAATGIISLITIFLYKDRKKQVLAVKFLLLLSAGVIYTLAQASNDLQDAVGVDMQMSIGFYLPIVMVLLLVLAIRGIGKDDDLIRASERLR
ncbi:MAG: DUF4293 domain-containing protein [Flavobacteriales bacterium]|nr:DUF4293 domain-containing protein [Flavobacteriales bacterium]